MGEYCDVNHLSELPILPEELAFLDFIGGTKELRCFVVSKNMPRNQFIEENEHLLDECLLPIYKYKGICVKQDASYPLPGFYIVSPIGHYRSLDEVDEVTHLRLFFILREIRKAMREVLQIEHIHIHYEEKMNKTCNVHYWLLPINDMHQQPRLYDFKIRAYLESFRFAENRDKIILYNEKLKKHLIENHLTERDENLLNTISSIFGDENP